MTPLLHALHYQPWLITPETHAAMLRALSGTELFSQDLPQPPEPELLTVENGIGIVTIHGALMKQPVSHNHKVDPLRATRYFQLRMKVGAQTVVCGNSFELPTVLDVIAAAGCLGVEFSQRPGALGDLDDLLRLLEERRLELIGLSGDTLQARIDYCGDYRPGYLYVEEWDERVAVQALEKGFTLALHPHLFKPVHRLDEAFELLDTHGGKYPRFKFLPDSAHLTIAGDLPADALRRAGANRLAAVHVKDWTPEYGRSKHRYARGFTALGQGSVDFEGFFIALREIGFDGWVVFEQGSATTSPAQHVHQSTRWLQKRGVRARLSSPGIRRAVEIPTPEKPRFFAADAERRFLETVLAATTNDVTQCYPTIATALAELIPSQLLMVCTCSPAAKLMTVLAMQPLRMRLPNYVVSYPGTLSNVALERQTVTRFDLTRQDPGTPFGFPNARFGYPQLLKNGELRTMISLPVLNPTNPHQARLVINLFPQTGHTLPPDEDLVRIGGYIGIAVDSALDERCSFAAAGASYQAGRCQQVAAFLEEMLKLVKSVLDCEAVTILLVDDAERRLEVAASTGVGWKEPDPSKQFYRQGEGLTGKVWQRREVLLTLDPKKAPGYLGKSFEMVAGESESFICAPWIDPGNHVVAVIRCQNKRGQAFPAILRGGKALHMFTDDDVAAVEAIGQAAVPHLQVLVSKERRARALRRLTHELHAPLVAIRGALSFMQSELKARPGGALDFFTEDYVADIESWSHLMRRLLGNADYFRLTSKNLPLYQQRTQIMGEIIIPAIRQVSEVLHEREFDPKRIKIGTFEDVPSLWIDRNQFQQVIFNLLANAIKYASDDPHAFAVRIRGSKTDVDYLIEFEDDGPGIPTEMSEAIFAEGVRSREARFRHVAGDGLGLWVVRKIIEAHGGQIALTSAGGPTTFAITLPRWLAFRKTPIPEK